jgi:hypothetical protein
MSFTSFFCIRWALISLRLTHPPEADRGSPLQANVPAQIYPSRKLGSILILFYTLQLITFIYWRFGIE